MDEWMEQFSAWALAARWHSFQQSMLAKQRSNTIALLLVVHRFSSQQWSKKIICPEYPVGTNQSTGGKCPVDSVRSGTIGFRAGMKR